MRKGELKNLKIGDIVSVISRNSRNYGKRGIVFEIGPIWDGRGSTGIFVKPLDCEFEFGKGQYFNEKEITTHTYMYRHTALRVENQEIKETKKIEKRDQSLSFKFVGSEEDVKKMIEEVKEIVKNIAPEAKLQILKGER